MKTITQGTLILFYLFTFNSHAFCQEKRLALVIGNADYAKGKLSNPVNDAILIANTLRDLSFEVILDTNIATLDKFNSTVRKFGELRPNYSVGLIYYAGHGIQINNVNYLLPTQENFLTQYDVEDKALSVQKIMRYIEDKSEEVNVLILDACRDNPFEKNWLPKERSSLGGMGLAKINPPTGSLVAYSTDAGNTAADGAEKNSVYCLSLAKNMKIEDLTLDQVFRNVRSEVLKSSRGQQRPVEASQLTGEAFYLKKSSYLEIISEIDSLLEKENYTLALEKTSGILSKDPTNRLALCMQGRAKMYLLKDEYDGTDFTMALKLYPQDKEVQLYFARYKSYKKENENAIKLASEIINNDSTFAEGYYWKGRFLEEDKLNEDAFYNYSKAIELDPKNPEFRGSRGFFYQDVVKDYNKALIDFSSAIELNPNNLNRWYIRGGLYADYLNETEKAISDFSQVLRLDSTDVDAINAIGVIYENKKQYELAKDAYEKGIALEKTNPTSAAYCYRNRADLYVELKLLDSALIDYSKAIELDPKNAEFRGSRGLFYQDVVKDYNKALIDFSSAIELNPNNLNRWYIRGGLYADYLNETEKAISDFSQVLRLDSTNVDAINAIGVIYENKKQYELAKDTYEKGIALEKTNPTSAAYCYRNRADVNVKLNLIDSALSDYCAAIKIETKNPDFWAARAVYYRDVLSDYNKALCDFNKAIELDSININYWYERGYLYVDFLKDSEKGLLDFNQVLNLDSTNIDAINAIGLVYKHNGQLELAKSTFEKGIRFENINPESAAISYCNRADIFSMEHKLEKSFEDFSKAIYLDPLNGDLYYYRALFFKDHRKDYNNALIDFTKSIELDSTDIGNYLERGKLYAFELDQYDKGILDFQKAIEIDSNDVVVLNWMGALYDRYNDTEKALYFYDKTISKIGLGFKDSIWDYSNGIAWSFSNKGGLLQNYEKYNDALWNYSKAIELDSQNPERHVIRSWHYFSFLSDYKKAIEDINKAIQIDPENPYYYQCLFHVYERAGENKRAIEALNNAIDKSKNDPIYILERALFNIRLNNHTKALGDLEFVKNTYPEYRHAYYAWGKYFESLDSTELAINIYKEADHKFPNDTISNYKLGELFLIQKQYHLSLIYYLKAMYIMELRMVYNEYREPYAPTIYLSDIYYRIAMIYEALNQKELSCEFMEKTKKELVRDARNDKHILRSNVQGKQDAICN